MASEVCVRAHVLHVCSTVLLFVSCKVEATFLKVHMQFLVVSNQWCEELEL